VKKKNSYKSERIVRKKFHKLSDTAGGGGKEMREEGPAGEEKK